MCLGVIESSMFSFFSSSKNLTSKGLGLIQGIWVLWGESFQCKQMYSGCSPFLAASHTITIQESQRDCKEDPAREKLNSLHMHLKDRRQGPKKFCRGSRREKGSKQDKWTQSNLMQWCLHMSHCPSKGGACSPGTVFPGRASPRWVGASTSCQASQRLYSLQLLLPAENGAGSAVWAICVWETGTKSRPKWSSFMRSVNTNPR